MAMAANLLGWVVALYLPQDDPHFPTCASRKKALGHKHTKLFTGVICWEAV